MSWWGVIAGGAFGYMLGGPLGALLGAALGGQFSRATGRATGEAGGAPLGGGARERVQLAFFTATFAVMGHVAKADGRVSAEEIEMAQRVMRDLHLDARQRALARGLFNAGKAPDFVLDDALAQLRGECGRRANLLRMFFEIQAFAAFADGRLDPAERDILQRIADALGMPDADVEQILGAAAHAVAPAGRSLADDYATMGVAPDAGDDALKRAYRRLMSRCHPDKLAAQGLPEEMRKVATRRTQEIKAAYDRIRQARRG